MNGLDIEMGTLKPYNEYYMADSLLYFVRNGKVPMEKLDDKVRRVLKLNLRTAMNRNRPWGSFNTKEHTDLARHIAEQGIVLLKNRDNILPVDTKKCRKIAGKQGTDNGNKDKFVALIFPSRARESITSVIRFFRKRLESSRFVLVPQHIAGVLPNPWLTDFDDLSKIRVKGSKRNSTKGMCLYCSGRKRFLKVAKTGKRQHCTR